MPFNQLRDLLRRDSLLSLLLTLQLNLFFFKSDHLALESQVQRFNVVLLPLGVRLGLLFLFQLRGLSSCPLLHQKLFLLFFW